MDGVLAATAGSADTAEACALLRASFDTIPDPQILIEAVRDEAGRIVDFTYRDVNKAACDALDVARKDLLGRGLRDTLPNFSQSGLLDRYARCLATGEPVVLNDYPYRLRSQGRHCDVRAGRTDADIITVAWRDVTERVVDERRIAKSEEQFRLLAQNLGEGLFRISADGEILWMSESAERQFGRMPADVGRRIDEFVPREELADHFARLHAANRGESIEGRARAFGADGEVHWIRYSLKPFYGVDGTADGLVLTCRIIDDEVAVEQQAEEARRRQAVSDDRWRRMMETAAVGMAIAEPDGRFETVNQAICDFFGYREEVLTQLTWQELTAPEFLEDNLAAIEKVVSGELESYRTAKQFIHADGHRIWGDLAVSVLRTPDGDTERFIAQITDITAEVEARRLLSRREEQNRNLAKRLQAQTDRLTSELRSAAAYVFSILPEDLDGAVNVSSRYLPALELAGDCYDYRWIDDDHLVFYLVDVSGHGIQPALLSVSVHNLLRSGSLPHGVLLQPDHVLAELNELFAMDKHAGNYFTVWYGVYEASTRTLRFSSGGHPPALLLSGGSSTELSTRCLPVGMFADVEYHCGTASIAPGDTLLIYSDGVYEIPLPAGKAWSQGDFATLCGQFAATPGWTLDNLVEALRARTDAGVFDDDLSLMRLDFPPGD